LDNPKYNKIAIILVHGGYPYSFEAGYLAAMYPRLYLDISEMVPFVPLGSRQGIRNMLDMCPLNKIMYGSDGFVLPDLHWLGAKVAKQDIEAILSELIALGLQDQDLALASAGDIFFDTARKVYSL
jgi:predicted TIM-barrel fold metal-dependent hydrolase